MEAATAAINPKDAVVSGLILLAPMISVSIPRWQRRLLRTLNSVMPRKALFPPADDAMTMQFRDKQRRVEAETDALSYRGSLHVSSALSCLDLCKTVRRNLRLRRLNTPFLCLIASNDVVVDNDAIRTGLLELALTRDKMVKEYKGALHGLLCEARPLRDEIEDDILDWLFERTDAGIALHGIRTEMPTLATGDGSGIASSSSSSWLSSFYSPTVSASSSSALTQKQSGLWGSSHPSALRQQQCQQQQLRKVGHGPDKTTTADWQRNDDLGRGSEVKDWSGCSRCASFESVLSGLEDALFR